METWDRNTNQNLQITIAFNGINGKIQSSVPLTFKKNVNVTYNMAVLLNERFALLLFG